MQTRTEEFVEGIFALAASDTEADEKQRVAATRVHEFEEWLANVHKDDIGSASLVENGMSRLLDRVSLELGKDYPEPIMAVLLAVKHALEDTVSTGHQGAIPSGRRYD
jgi:hypothetical protein